jgi:hypothetical protein
MVAPLPDPIMWGTTQTVILPAGIPAQPSQQLARVELDRPQSWAFLFTGQIPQPLATPNTDVRFEITAGLGRSAVTIAIARLRVNSTGELAWTTSAFTNGLIDPITDTVTSQLVSFFPAQQIQCQAVIENGPPTGGQIIVGAFFAPLSHTPWDKGGGDRGMLEDLPWHGGGPDEQ